MPPSRQLDLSTPARGELDDLCKDRPYTSPEIVEQNAYYGHDQIVKQYAGTPVDRPLKFGLPHGVESSIFRPFPVRPRVPISCYYTPGRAALYDLYRVLGEYRPIATPFHYLTKMLGELDDERRAGTLFFPNHSGPFARTNGHTYRVTAQIAQRVAALPERYQPVRVCIYWWDYLLGRHEPFRDAGLEIVSAGHMLDPNFLVRLYRLCSEHRFAMSNELGTHCFYAIRAGCEYIPLRGALAPVELPYEFDDLLYHHLSHVHDRFDDIPARVQRDVTDFFLGVRYEVSPDDLRAFIEYAERQDRTKLTIARPERPGLPRVVLPAAWRRASRSVARRAVDTARSARGVRRGGADGP